MGAMAEAIMAYSQPLIDQTDGSLEEMNKALAIATLCYNLALTPEAERDAALDEFRSAFRMDDRAFDEFRSAIVIPMIQRHKEMFPLMHRRQRAPSSPFVSGPAPREEPRKATPAVTHPGIDRYAPCPCKSGEKYKFCCGAKRR